MYDIRGIAEPKTLDEALKILNENQDLTIIAGGTDVLVKLHEERMTDLDLLSIKEIEELRMIKLLSNGTIEIGSMTTFTDIFRSDLLNKKLYILVEAAVSMGGPQIRNNATIGGNVCNGAVSGDSAPALFALNAKLKLRNANTERIVAIEDFYVGPGKVAIEKNEILVSILIEKKDYENINGTYIKFATRKAMDISLMGVAVAIKVNGNKFEDVRVALGVAGPTPLRCANAEVMSKGLEITDENMHLIAKEALKSSRAIDFWNASKDFKNHLVEELTYRGLVESVKRVGGK
ncbi:MAG: xanthine dehydrogenase FAD-binding subunit XdhB [Sarcina sp.]